MRRPVLLDTNLLILFVVGLTSKDYIRMHKRLSQFSTKDFESLENIVSEASELVSTPNILSETSNLLDGIRDPAKTEIYTIFSAIIQGIREDYLPSKEAATRSEFVRLGLADSVSIHFSLQNMVLITVDLPLYLEATRQGATAINFNHYLT